MTRLRTLGLRERRSPSTLSKKCEGQPYLAACPMSLRCRSVTALILLYRLSFFRPVVLSVPLVHGMSMQLDTLEA